MLRIAVDAMGGDHAPHEVVAGSLAAAHGADAIEILLVGHQDRLEAELESLGGAPDNLHVVHAPDAIAMGESPVDAVKKRPEASILVACGLVREGRAEAVIAAGSTGATVAACAMKLRRLKGVRRPGIAVPMPSGNRHGITLLMDGGANPSCRPHHLQQYAVMGSNYYREMWGEKNPRVALVSIGEEDSKGTELTKEAAALLRDTDVNFVGNVEQLFSDRCEVALADGFVGNIVLKTAESVGEMVFSMLAEVVAGSDPVAFKNIASRMDYAEFGGAPLLGVDGTVLICHGRSDRRAIANAIRAGARAVGHHVNDNIVKGLTRAPQGAET